VKTQSVSINKINWKKVNESLSQAGLSNNEVNTLNAIFGSIVEAHTELNELIFVRQYMFSVIIRLHNYLKECHMIQNTENLKDIYDYIISTLILSIEISTNISISSGISFLITRVMNKIFDIESTNSALILIDNRFPLKQKYTVEPIIANSADKISIDRAKEYIDFIFNLFSYCDASTRCVSVSVLCSSMWIKDFEGLPYFVDDSIVQDFSTNPQNIAVINSLLLARRQNILESFNGEDNGLDLGNYSFKEFIKQEPDSLYKELKEFQDNLGMEDEEAEYDFLDDDEEDERSHVIQNAIAEAAKNDLLPEPMENEIKIFDNYLTDLNYSINGPFPKSGVSSDVVKGIDKERLYPRIRGLFSEFKKDEVTIQGIIKEQIELDKDLSGKKNKTLSKEEIIRNVNDTLKEIEEKNKEKESVLKDTNYLTDKEYLEKSFDSSKITKDFTNWADFTNYMNEMLGIYSKKGKVDTSVLLGFINSYNKRHNTKFVFKNIKENNGEITLDHFKGKKVVDKCKYKDGSFKCTYVSD